MRDGQRPSPRGCFSPLALSLTLALASLATAAQAQTAAGAQSAQRFSIAAGPLAPALNRFAQQAGVALVMDAGRVAGLRTQGLNGSFSVADGFAQLLKGTGHRRYRKRTPAICWRLQPPRQRRPHPRRSRPMPCPKQHRPSQPARTSRWKP